MQEGNKGVEDNKNLVIVEKYSSDMEAQLAQTTLKAAGIDSVIMRDGADGMLQVLEYIEGISLLVNEEEAEEAKALLEERASLDSDEPGVAG